MMTISDCLPICIVLSVMSLLSEVLFWIKTTGVVEATQFDPEIVYPNEHCSTH